YKECGVQGRAPARVPGCLPYSAVRPRPAGVTDFEPAYGRRGAITGGTHMTLFTAEASSANLRAAEVRPR
ncbi:MAG: hypothetical protein ACRELC_12195, partial [Gemmatimonadota bacterium]